MTLLSETVRYAIDGAQLRLETADGRALAFSRSGDGSSAVEPPGTLTTAPTP